MPFQQGVIRYLNKQRAQGGIFESFLNIFSLSVTFLQKESMPSQKTLIKVFTSHILLIGESFLQNNGTSKIKRLYLYLKPLASKKKKKFKN
jgi:hypothetical protein